MYKKIYNHISDLCQKLEFYQEELKKKFFLQSNSKIYFADPKSINDFLNGNIGTFTIHKITPFHI